MEKINSREYTTECRTKIEIICVLKGTLILPPDPLFIAILTKIPPIPKRPNRAKTTRRSRETESGRNHDEREVIPSETALNVIG
jgi:hypothetical protein